MSKFQNYFLDPLYVSVKAIADLSGVYERKKRSEVARERDRESRTSESYHKLHLKWMSLQGREEERAKKKENREFTPAWAFPLADSDSELFY